MASTEPAAGQVGRAGEVYGQLLADLLTLENARKASIEQRGITVITTAGVLVSLLLALSALLLGKDATFPTGSRWLLVAAIVAFIGAAGLGLAANTPRTYSALSTGDLARMTADFSWSADKDEAALIVARRRAEEYKTSREKNNKKAQYVQWSIVVQVIGVCLVGISIAVAVLF